MLDWKLKLMQIITCFSECEGTWYSGSWKNHGVTDEEQAIIENEYDRYCQEQRT